MKELQAPPVRRRRRPGRDHLPNAILRGTDRTRPDPMVVAEGEGPRSGRLGAVFFAFLAGLGRSGGGAGRSGRAGDQRLSAWYRNGANLRLRRVRQTAAVALSDRGKSGLRRTGSWVTPRRGDPTESAAETRPPMARPRAQARVKRWCKRPPASRETGVAGKPLPEQGRAEAPAVRRSSLGWTAPRPDGNAGPRWMAVARQRVQNPAYRRTRRPFRQLGLQRRRARPPRTPPQYPTVIASAPNSSSVHGPAGLPPARLRAATAA